MRLFWTWFLGFGVAALVACGDTNVTVYCGTDVERTAGGSGGSAGTGGTAGGVNGTGGTSGVTADEFPCTEQGIRDAIAQGGGPYGFACDGPTTVTTSAEIVIDNDVVLDGSGNLTIDGANNHRVLEIAAGTDAGLRGLAVTRGSDSAIVNYGSLMISNCTVSASSNGFMGGGILNVEGATMSITESDLSGNRAGDGGGAVANDPGATMSITDTTVSGNTASEGGGVHNWGTLTMSGVVVSGNAVSPGGSIGEGGAIANWGTLALMNSTVSGNGATAGGGGIYNSRDGGGGRLSIVATTLSGNSSRSGADGIFSNGGSVTVSASLVDDDCDGAITSNGYNVESPGDTCGFDQVTDQVDVTTEELRLGELADHGGPTATHPLGAGSVAVDVIPESECLDVDGAPLTADQRGYSRPGGSSCDVGAFELQPVE